MSPSMHALCETCHQAVAPDREPCRIGQPRTETCCRCGRDSRSGIYHRADPTALSCRGVHREAS